MILKTSDFNIPPYAIPSDSLNSTFLAFAAKEERFYLLEVLGDNLYNAFIDGLGEFTEWSQTVATVIGQYYSYGNDVWQALTVTTGVTPTEGADWTKTQTNNRWLLLKNGNYYEINGKRYYWDGMVNALTALIFSRWISMPNLTKVGFVIPSLENNTWQSPNEDICRSWNDWSRRIGGHCAQYNTLYGYLYYTNLADGTFDDTFDETFYDTFIDYLNYEFKSQGCKNVLNI